MAMLYETFLLGQDSKSEKVYHLVRKRLKLPFWDRVQKNRVLMRYFEKMQ